MPHIDQHVPDVTDSASARTYLVQSLRRDLIGPSWHPESTNPNNEELLILDRSSQPSRFYLSGMLMPKILDDDESDQHTSHTEAIKEDEVPPEFLGIEDSDDRSKEKDNEHLNRVRSGDGLLSPRSIGMTIRPSVDGSDWEIKVQYEWGTYRQEKVDEERREVTWKRTHHVHNLEIRSEQFVETSVISHTCEENQDVRVHIRVEKSDDGPRVTIRLVNDAEHHKSNWSEICNSTMLQAKLSVNSDSNLHDVRKRNSSTKDPMDLLYSDSFVYASGHNVGVDWNYGENKAWTEAIPSYEVPLVRSDEELQNIIPKLDDLCDRNLVHDALHGFRTEFVTRYQEWVKEETRIFNEDNQVHGFEELFEQNRNSVKNCINRINDGIEYLLQNDIAREAFILANRSIRFSQRDESLHSDHRLPNFEWRPFQLAFQLLNVTALFESNSNDRKILDLAWFPTGGGKTEAYLGLIGMISFFRRLDPNSVEKEALSPGVSTIMRYTLRLLTADQAGRLIRLCGAMNKVWADNKGADVFAPFTVGMWIGESSSPNKFFRNPRFSGSTTVQDIFDLHTRNEQLPESTFIQFTTCPWCGDESIGDVDNWEIDEVHSNGRIMPKLKGSCSNHKCQFHDSIPFSCVDEDLYLHPPTILLGTVDKMVQLAHNNFAKSVKYGEMGNGEPFTVYPENNARRMLGFDRSGPLPPDLIIQDELHLLSGPLGSLAGMIETSLSAAWQHIGHSPKYVAATATIRGADRDIGLIYGRELNVFPPPLRTAKDNFFAKEQIDTQNNPGRIHMGILAPPRRARSATEQPTASLLQTAQNLKENGAENDVIDPYWTLVMYYNSLRELGGGQSALRENIPRWMNQYGKATQQNIRNLAEGGDVELTSRKSAAELAISRQRLNIKLGSDPSVVDVLSTSNMFQVGVDIPRLGLMSIIGQPRSNSEYIQSSGRVGRKSDRPGLVLSILRGTYPRDQSHYEQFRSFHQEFYRHVDFTSVTPFTHRALDRGFATSLMMLLRMGCERLSPKSGLSELKGNQVRDEAEGLVTRFTEMVRSRQTDIDNASEELVEEAVRIIESEWDRLQRFVDGTDVPVWWIVWNDLEIRSHNPKPLSWMTSPFRDLPPIYEGHVVDGLPSLRDVADEVQLKSEKGFNFITMPEGHLMSHMGPGNIWEKGGIPYMTNGISLWDNTIETGFRQRTNGSEALNPASDGAHSGQLIEEPSLSTILGPGKALRLLPRAGKDGKNFGKHGAITYKEYPWIHVCDIHGHIGQTTFDSVQKKYICSHNECGSSTRPSRFVSLCEAGHMQPFDYWFWVHSGRNNGCTERNRMRLRLGNDSALTLSNWVVHCDACGLKRDMLQVPWVKADDRRDAPPCKGKREWLARGAAGNETGCEHRMVHRQVGNTSVTMNDGGSIMLIPPYTAWKFVDRELLERLRAAHSKEQFTEQWMEDVERGHYSISRYAERLRGTGFQNVDESLDHQRLIDTIWDYYEQNSGERILTIENLRSRERLGLLSTDGNAIDDSQFYSSVIAGGLETQPESWREQDWPLSSANQIHRLTELRYVDGIRRLKSNSVDDHGNYLDPQPIDLPSARPNPPEEEFGIGMYNYGEGLYFDIKPAWLNDLGEQRRSMGEHRANMSVSFDKLMHSMTKQLPALEEEDSRSAFTVLHTLSHLLIKSLVAKSGFSLGSVRERLYFDYEDGNVKHAGILLYTSAPSSDGTLGGLVQQGSSVSKIDEIVQAALESLEFCSNDPICFEHLPTADETNGAACHTCVLLPETSCELANHMLDRNWGV